MGTRGIYGFRRNGKDKLTYNHYDSNLKYLGTNVVDFCRNTSISDMNRIYDSLILIDNYYDKPTLKQQKECENWTDLSVGNKSKDDWYCLLSRTQGDLNLYNQGLRYMINNNNFILNSLVCEYGYIINLDTNKLEFWFGFQDIPDQNNRYGYELYNEYYPCKKVFEIDLDNIPDDIIEIVNNIKKESKKHSVFDNIEKE